MDRKSFILYTEYEEPIFELTDEEAGKVFKALFSYVKNSDENDIKNGCKSVVEAGLKGAAKMAFMFIKNDIDINAKKYEETLVKRREAGKKGGRPVKQKKAKKANGFSDEEQKASALFAFEKNPDNVNDNDNVNENVNDNKSVNINSTAPQESPRSEPDKKKYGRYENVLLSDSELETWKREAPESWRGYIERLSGYMESTGTEYNNHLATLRRWKQSDKERDLSKNGENRGNTEEAYEFKSIDKLFNVQ